MFSVIVVVAFASIHYPGAPSPFRLVSFACPGGKVAFCQKVRHFLQRCSTVEAVALTAHACVALTFTHETLRR